MRSLAVYPPVDRVDRPLDAFRREAAAVVGHADGAVRLERIHRIRGAACISALLGVDEQFDPAVERALALKPEHNAAERTRDIAEVVRKQTGHAERARLRRRQVKTDIAKRRCAVRDEIFRRNDGGRIGIALCRDNNLHVVVENGNPFKREGTVRPGLCGEFHAADTDGRSRRR